MVTVADVIADNGVVHGWCCIITNPGCDPNVANYDSTAVVDDDRVHMEQIQYMMVVHLQIITY